MRSPYAAPQSRRSRREHPRALTSLELRWDTTSWSLAYKFRWKLHWKVLVPLRELPWQTGARVYRLRARHSRSPRRARWLWPPLAALVPEREYRQRGEEVLALIRARGRTPSLIEVDLGHRDGRRGSDHGLWQRDRYARALARRCPADAELVGASLSTLSIATGEPDDAAALRVLCERLAARIKRLPLRHNPHYPQAGPYVFGCWLDVGDWQRVQDVKHSTYPLRVAPPPPRPLIEVVIASRRGRWPQLLSRQGAVVRLGELREQGEPLTLLALGRRGEAWNRIEGRDETFRPLTGPARQLFADWCSERGFEAFELDADESGLPIAAIVPRTTSTAANLLTQLVGKLSSRDYDDGHWQERGGAQVIARAGEVQFATADVADDGSSAETLLARLTALLVADAKG